MNSRPAAENDAPRVFRQILIALAGNKQSRIEADRIQRADIGNRVGGRAERNGNEWALLAHAYPL